MCASSSSCISLSIRDRRNRPRTNDFKRNRATSHLFRSRFHHDGNGFGKAFPVILLGSQLLATGCRQAVKLGLPFVLAFTPLRTDPSLLFEPVQRRIK